MKLKTCLYMFCISLNLTSLSPKLTCLAKWTKNSTKSWFEHGNSYFHYNKNIRWETGAFSQYFIQHNFMKPIQCKIYVNEFTKSRKNRRWKMFFEQVQPRCCKRVTLRVNLVLFQISRGAKHLANFKIICLLVVLTDWPYNF